MATTRDSGVAGGLVKGLGLVDSTTLVVGSMIGSGVFIVAADISRQVQSPGLMMMTWFVTAILTLIAALSYGELAAAMPDAGGSTSICARRSGRCSDFSTAGRCSW
jgi:basic amino acid/polyamine antiporter, APA family